MSRLTEKLQRLAMGAAQPIGFRAAVSGQKSPSMLLIAVLSEGEVDAASLAAGQGVDGVLLPTMDVAKEAQIIAQVKEKVGDAPWGAWVEGADKERIKELGEMGCDFLVFDAEKTPPDVLAEEKAGRVLRIDPYLPDGLAFTISQLPIDAVLIDGGATTTIGWVMACQRLANLVRKPLITSTASGLTEEDLKALRDAGVMGVAVKGHLGESLSKIKKAIEALPPPGKKGRAEPLIPYQPPIGTSEEEEE